MRAYQKASAWGLQALLLAVLTWAAGGAGPALDLRFAPGRAALAEALVTSPPQEHHGERPLLDLGIRVSAQMPSWNTFQGSDADDENFAIGVDTNGNVYVAGISRATWGNPIRPFNGAPDAFVAKLDSQGNLIWNTFLGGTDHDCARAMAVDGNGNVYVTGESWASWGSPVRPFSDEDDVFVAKITTDGTLVWHTFLGGDWWDDGWGIAVHGTSAVYVGGFSGNWGIPIRPYSSNDAFVAKLAAESGVIQWNTFLGSFSWDKGWAIACDTDGNAYITGESASTWGTPRRAFVAGKDAFVAKLNSEGSLLWNTFLGGSADDFGYAIAVSTSGRVWVAGDSRGSWGSPTRPYSGASDGFVAELNSNGDLVWNTFLGAAGDDYGRAAAVRSPDSVVVGGWSTTGWGAPVCSGYTADVDGFVTVLSDGAVVLHRFVGGSGYDAARSVAMGPDGSVYVAGLSDATWGTPVRAYTAGVDAFAAMFPASLGCTRTFVPLAMR